MFHNKKIFTVFVLLLCIPLFVAAQGRKDFRDAGIKKVIEYKHDYKTGKEKKIKNSEVTYDENGNETEMIEYDDFGKITLHEKYTYNDKNDKTSVTVYDATGKVKKVTKYTLNENGDRITATDFDGTGKLKKTTKYSYYGKFRTGKEVYDPANKMTSKKTYEYVR